MDDFVQVDLSNKISSLKHLRRENYWIHFERLMGFYRNLLENLQRGDPVQEVKHHYLSSCSINLAKGVKNVLGGHFTDSSIFVRKTIEGVRYTAFLRDNSDVVELWGKIDGKVDFDKRYKKWFSEGPGKEIVETEFPKSDEHYKYASKFGPHSNQFLFSRQHIAIEDGYRILYTEIEDSQRGYNAMLSNYFWHLAAHLMTIKWWVYKSGLEHPLTEVHLSDLSICYAAFMHDEANVIRRTGRVQHGPLNKPADWVPETKT